ncbi:dTDP-4-dehydrorhamnose 3,5-epimerase family protein [Petroclostridium xylanilyticum]|jgi:dTDP-4-dehydrorhamnose 3,5-epimerase|uniref:dTDP-4-dehydrorhamnose 3,5-epimerase family protein n=1 Tax=Petroclostridium xylanilyticum TaxID=1792311 RepID=UPI000B992808|nr:dTDP-4-dehydrorhamnose 3,5-epimerase family protein [Petroclostridium xylanilyticum]
MEFIQGVKIKQLKSIPDERGRLMEMLRADDDIFIKFGQVYLTTAYPGVVKAWHYHKKQTDNFIVIKGMMKVVLYDDRKDSPTFGKINEFFMGDYNQILLQIPNGVFHGFKCIGETEAIVINIPTEVYNYSDPDEFRVDPHNNDIPYNWERKDG